jgi:hypothetical protein
MLGGPATLFSELLLIVPLRYGVSVRQPETVIRPRWFMLFCHTLLSYEFLEKRARTTRSLTPEFPRGRSQKDLRLGNKELGRQTN